MTELHMRAYHRTFEPTGEICADRILSAIASAGKAYHSTGEWCEESNPKIYGQEGDTPWEWIENAAKKTASEVEVLRAKIELLEGFVHKLEGVMGLKKLFPQEGAVLNAE